MIRLFKGIGRWSLEIAGGSIIWYNYVSNSKQSDIKGTFYSFLNTYRTTQFIFQTYRSLQALKTQGQSKSTLQDQKIKIFHEQTAELLANLCMKNQGIYAKIGATMASMKYILPEQYIKHLQKLKKNENSPPMSYDAVKSAIESQMGLQMKELFDGFQQKPFSYNTLSQSHRAILKENYREVLVEVKIPYIEKQNEWDLWFLNKCREKAFSYISKNFMPQADVQHYFKAYKLAQESVNKYLNYEQELNNAKNNRIQAIKDNSFTYVPYYFSKYCNNNIIIKQFVEGCSFKDTKGLRELKLTKTQAFGILLVEYLNNMKKYMTVPSVNQDSTLIRKYIKPYVPKSQEDEIGSIRQTRINPPFHVIFLNQKSCQKISDELVTNFTNLWNEFRKVKKITKLVGIDNLYQKYLNAKKNPKSIKQLLDQKLYVFDSFLNLKRQIFVDQK